MNPLLSHYPTVKIGDLLTSEQIAETVRIMQLGLSEHDEHKMIANYYKQFHEELLRKGVLSDFLAYAVPFWIKENL